MPDDFARLRAALDEAGVEGGQDLGRFVSNTDYFTPSVFDERAGMPVLLGALPSLADAKAVRAVAGHLRRPWARGTAFEALLSAFKKWAVRDATTGWALGDALMSAAESRHADVVLELALDARYGTARQMVVFALWRFRKEKRVTDGLRDLCTDPDVCLHAMSAYRRAVGPQEALVVLEWLREHPDPTVRKQAVAQAKKAAKAGQQTAG